MNKQTVSGNTAGDALYWLLLAWLVTVYCYLLYATGWLSDDARITLVYVENLIRGNGAVFNLGERVQAYTHALWFLLLSAGTYVWHNPIQVTYFISVLLSIASFALLARIAVQRNLFTLLITGTLLLSAGFVDYSTSGLENPLSYFLFALLVLSASREHRPHRQFLRCGLLSSLIFLNRPDYALVVLPLLLYLWLSIDGWPRRFQLALLVAVPVLIWTAFSLFYYGVPVPNTAYAKLGTGLPRSELIQQGWEYYLVTARYDGFTLVILCLSLPCCLWWGNARVKLMATGVLLYLAYVLWIGGDFMLSRHLAVPAYLSIALLLCVPFGGVTTFASTNIHRGMIGLGLLAITLAALKFQQTIGMRTGEQFDHGISDERFFWSRFSNLKKELENGPRQWPQADATPRVSSADTTVKTMCGWLGLGKAMDASTFLVDKCGLTDPLLARLPALTTPQWRIGHFERAIPYGYLESIKGDTPAMERRLSEYAARIRLVTHGGLLDSERLNAITSLNLSNDGIAAIASDYHIDVQQLQASKKQSRDLAYAPGAEDAVASVQRGVSWRIRDGAGTAPSKMSLHVDHPGGYKVIFEYADLASYEPDSEYNWQQVDYVVAVLAEGEGESIELELPRRDFMKDLVYIHVVPVDDLNNNELNKAVASSRVSLTFL